MTDPRPDLTEDSALWTKLLTMADKINKHCAGTLNGFRCGGMRLKREPEGYALRPEFGDPASSSAWATLEEYAADRKKWLYPYTRLIIRLLNKLTEEVRE